MSWHGRRASSIENQSLRVTVLHEGGHIAEILDKPTGVNPLWTPPWPSIEPSAYNAATHSEYGANVESKLLAGIMGHNLCLDIFGGPSLEEAAAGIGVHGEGSVVSYDVLQDGTRLMMTAHFPLAQIRFVRTIELRDRTAEIRETVESLASFDRPIGWTQHVTLGPPFLECGVTQFDASATRSKIFEADFGADDYLAPGAEFDWPMAPRIGGGTADLRRFTNAPASSAFTAHQMNPLREDAFFTASHPGLRLTLRYSWLRTDFPWLGIWEENRSRKHAPWNGCAIACGMEFGASPIPETRRQMVDRGTLFGVPTFRWLPVLGRLEARYSASFE